VSCVTQKRSLKRVAGLKLYTLIFGIIRSGFDGAIVWPCLLLVTQPQVAGVLKTFGITSEP